MNLYQLLWEGRKKDEEEIKTPKKGVALFFEILLREFWPLIKLNLIFLLACLPVVTIGPALGAMNAVTMTMVQDRPSEVWHDFWQAFRKNFKIFFVCGLWGLVIFLLPCAAMVAYFKLASISLVFYFFFTLAVTAMLILALSWVYLFPLVNTIALPLPVLIKNSIFLGIVNLKYSLVAFLLTVLLCGGMLLCIPTTLPFVFLSAFSFPTFIASFAAWSGIRQYVSQEAQH